VFAVVRKDELQRINHCVRKVWLVAIADGHAIDGPLPGLVEHEVSFLDRCAQVVQSSAALGGAARQSYTTSQRIGECGTSCDQQRS
jgi:hypothetical protein